MTKLPPGVVRYLLIGNGVIPFFINIAVNGVLGLLIVADQESIPTLAMNGGAASDTIGTCFFLPFITCLIVTPIVRRQVARNVATSVCAGDLHRWTHSFRGRLFPRALKCGIAGFVMLSGPVFALYSMLAGDSISTVRFLAIKVVFAGMLGFVVTPLIALLALSDAKAHTP